MRGYQWLAAAALAAFGSTGAAAQSPLEVEVTPMVGGVLYLGELPSSFQLTGENGEPGTVGAGLDVALHPGASLRLEGRDHMSLFDPELDLDEEVRHDLALSAGLGVSFGPGGDR